MKNTFIAAIFVFSILVTIALAFARRKRLQKYWSRSCTGANWRQRFPDSPKNDIRTFVQAFVEAFAFSSEKRFKFDPDDKVMDIYHALYPPGSAIDSMELEAFASKLKRLYEIDMTKINNPDITLGQLFEMSRNLKKGISTNA